MREEKWDTMEPCWKSFWALIVMQLQNSFTVSAIKFLIIPLAAWIAVKEGRKDHTEHILSILLVLPYLVLAPTAGWIGDRFRKANVMRLMVLCQWIIVLLLTGAMAIHSMPLSLLCFFLYATQCCILSPAKMGSVKEIVGSKYLAYANGIVEGTVVLAILAGQVIGGVAFDFFRHKHMSGWDSALKACIWLSVISLIGFVVLLIKKEEAQSTEEFSWKIMTRHFYDSVEVWSDHKLRGAALGVAYFWGFAGFINLVVVAIAKQLHPDGEGVATSIAILMVAASVGIAAGSVFAGMMSKGRINWKLAPIGFTLMISGLFVLAFLQPGTWAMRIMLALTGAGAAMFLVPVNTYVQDHPPSEKRGLVLSVSNFFNNIFGITAVVVQLILLEGFKLLEKQMQVPFFGIRAQFATMALITLCIALYAKKTWRPS